MKTLIVKPEQFKEALDKFEAELRCGTNNSEMHFYSKCGKYIIEYHLPVKTQFMNTTEPINYDTEATK